jgi:hypothetical protein
MAKSLRERQIDAEERCNRYLADANELEERGQWEKAKPLRAKQQFWLDRMNLLCGDGDSPGPKR